MARDPSTGDARARFRRKYSPQPVRPPRPIDPSLKDKAAVASIFLPPALTGAKPGSTVPGQAPKPGVIASERRGLSLGVGVTDKRKWARQPDNDLRAVPRPAPPTTRRYVSPTSGRSYSFPIRRPSPDYTQTGGGFVRSVGNATADFAKSVARRIAIASTMQGKPGAGPLGSPEAQAVAGIGAGLSKGTEYSSDFLLGKSLTNVIQGNEAPGAAAVLEGISLLPFLRGPAAAGKVLRAAIKGEKVAGGFARAYEESRPIVSAARAVRKTVPYGRGSARDAARLYDHVRPYTLGEGDNVLTVEIPGAGSRTGRLGEKVWDAARPVTSKTRLVKTEEQKAGVEFRNHLQLRSKLLNVPGETLRRQLRGLDDAQVYALRVAGERVPPDVRAKAHRAWAAQSAAANRPEEVVYHAAHASLIEDAAQYIEIAPDGLATLSADAPQAMQDAWQTLHQTVGNREDIIHDLGLLTDEQMARRVYEPGQVFYGGEWKDTEEIISDLLARHRGRQALHDAIDQIDIPAELKQAEKNLHDARARYLAQERGAPENIDLYYGPMQTQFHLDRFVPQEVIDANEELSILLQNTEPLPFENLPEQLDWSRLRLAVEGMPLPKSMQTPEGFQETIERVYSYIREGHQYRHWYDVASRNVAEFADILAIPRDRASMVMAIYSQQAQPTENMRRAMIAMVEWKDTGKVTFSPFEGQAEKAQMVLDGASGWKGLKTSAYHANILEGIDPALFKERYGDAQLVTNDRWVAEMFDPSLKKSIPESLYPSFSNLYIEMARQLGWRPKEAQAASWIPMKARGMAATQSKRQGGKFFPHEKYIESASDAYGRALDKYFPDRPQWVDDLFFQKSDPPAVLEGRIAQLDEAIDPILAKWTKNLEDLARSTGKGENPVKTNQEYWRDRLGFNEGVSDLPYNDKEMMGLLREVPRKKARNSTPWRDRAWTLLSEALGRTAGVHDTGELLLVRDELAKDGVNMRALSRAMDEHDRLTEALAASRPDPETLFQAADILPVNRPVRVVSAADTESMEPRPGYFYHGTNPQAEQSILDEGVMHPGSRAPEAVWLVDDPKQAAFWGDRVFEIPESIIPPGSQTFTRFGQKWIGVTEDLPLRREIPRGPHTSSIDFEFTDGVRMLGADLSLEQKKALQVAMEEETLRLARTVDGLEIRGVEHGVGGWANGVNADFHLVVDGTPEAKDELAQKIGQAFDQELVQVSRTVARPNADSAAALVVTSPAFRSDDQKLAFFSRLNAEAPEYEGFMPGYRNGQPAVISRTTAPEAGPEFEARYAPLVKKIADDLGIEVQTSSENLELRISAQQGRVDRMTGRGEAGGVDELTGQVREARRRLEREIDKIRDPERQTVKVLTLQDAIALGDNPFRQGAYNLGRDEAHHELPYVFHGTNRRAAEAALRQGYLQPGGPLGGVGDVAWVAENPRLAARHADSKALAFNDEPVVLQIPRSAVPPNAKVFEKEGQFAGNTWSSTDRILLDTVGGEGGRARGLIIFSPDGRASIHFSESSDVSTIEHELAHYMRRVMAGTPHEHDVAAWAGAKWDSATKTYVWDRAAEEKYANAVVSFHRTGRGPSVVRNELKRVSAELRRDFRLKDLPDLPPNVAESIGRLLRYSKPKGGRMVGGEDFILQAEMNPIYLGQERGVPLTLKQAGSDTSAYIKGMSLFGAGRHQALGAGPQDARLRKAFKGSLYRSGLFKTNLDAPTKQLALAVRMSEAHRVRGMLLKGSTEVPRTVTDIAIKVDPKKTVSPRLSALWDRIETLQAQGAKLDERDLENLDFDLIEQMKHDLFPTEVDGVPLAEVARTALQNNEPIPNIRWVSSDFLHEADLLGKPGKGRLAGLPQGPKNAVVWTWDGVNDVQKGMLLYLNPAYGPMQIFGNSVMSLLHQGIFMPVRLYQAATLHRALSPQARVALDMMMGHGGTASLFDARTPGQAIGSSMAHWISLAVDLMPRRAAFLHEAARVGIKGDELDRLLVDAVKGHEAAIGITDSIYRKAQDAIGPFDRMSPWEKQYAARIIIFYPWLRAATRYTSRFVLEHPMQSIAIALAADYAWGNSDEKLGNRPAFAKDTFPIGTDTIGVSVPGTDIGVGLSDLVGHHNWESHGYPMTVSARQMFTMTTPLDLLRSGLGFASGDPTASSPLENLAPAWYAGIVAGMGYDPFLQKEVPRSPSTFVDQITQFPAKDRLDKITMSEQERADRAPHALYPRTQGQEIARLFGGSLTPTPYNPVVGEDMANAEEKASPEQKVVQHREKLMSDLDTVSKQAKVPVPPVVRQQADALARLDANPKRLTDDDNPDNDRQYDYEERLATIIDLYAEQYPAEAARIRRESRGAKGDVAREWYLDLRSEMFQDYRDWLNEYDTQEG